MVVFTQPKSNDANGEVDGAALAAVSMDKTGGHSVTLIEPVALAHIVIQT